MKLQAVEITKKSTKSGRRLLMLYQIIVLAVMQSGYLSETINFDAMSNWKR